MDGLGDVGIGGGQGLQDPNINNASTKQQQKPRAPNARQTVVPFVEPPISRPSKYKEFGLQNPRNNYPLKSWSSLLCLGDKRTMLDGVWCKWCGNLYGPNVTHLTQHFTSEFAPRERGNMELPAFKREGF
ncbi:hypothetical protein R1flu_016742 [Riccia fluitans]|uniref:BED-type domain-containing protein n=1 Tax=Riccia fluitans TaxID=41844 RepID=A0ABD1YMQ1_9MARC